MGVLILVLMAVLNGVFAMAEVAVISARRPRLQQSADEGSSSAQRALSLMDDPDRFLSTVQIGITLIGVFTGAFGGVALSAGLAELLVDVPGIGPYSQPLAVALIVLFSTYLSLVIGELVPKRLALLYSERIAMLVAGPMNILSRLTAPVVWLLSASSTAVMWLLGQRNKDEVSATDADIRAMMRQGAAEGVFAKAEPDMVAGVLSLDTKPVVSIMIPRTEMVWLDTSDPDAENIRKVIDSHKTRFPVIHEEVDELIGFIETKDLLNRALAGKPFDLRSILREPLFIPEMTSVLRALEIFKQSRQELAIVIGEYGDIKGMITVNDVIEEVVGDIDQEDPQATQRADGSWLIDGLYPADDFERLFDVTLTEDERRYQTVSGFVLTHMERIPKASDVFEWGGLRVEVVDMDGKRIDKVMVTVLD